MPAVFSIALPVFTVIAIGFAAGRLALAAAEDAAALNRFVFRFGFPAALFALMSSATDFNAKDLMLALSYGIPAIGLMGTAYFLARTLFALDAQDSGAHAFASVFGNAVFLGLPVALAVDGWAKPFVTLMLVEGVVIISLGALLMSPRNTDTKRPVAAAFAAPLRNPLVVAALAGIAVAFFGIALPAPVRNVLDLFARAAGPVALFSLGLFLATRARLDLEAHGGKAGAIAAVKMAMLPALALAALQLSGEVDPDYRGALALFTVTPTAVGAYVIASQYGRYVDETVSAIAATTALSLAAITAVLILFA